MEAIKNNNERNEFIFGYLPLMCKSSIYQLSALSAQLFAERMVSCRNLIITKKMKKLDDNTINKLVVLRTNKIYGAYKKEQKKYVCTY